MAQSESIVDFFIILRQKSQCLSQALNGDFSGFKLEFGT